MLPIDREESITEVRDRGAEPDLYRSKCSIWFLLSPSHHKGRMSSNVPSCCCSTCSFCGKAGRMSNKMPQTQVGRVLHNGHCVKWGIRLCPDSQWSSESPEPSEPGTESAALSSSGSLSAQHRTCAIGECSHRLCTPMPCSLATKDFHYSLLVLLLLASSRVKVVQTSAEEAAQRNNRQSRCCVLDPGTWIAVHFLPFSSYPPPRSQQGSRTAKYAPAASTTYLP